jgi:hypothetical protein
MDSVETYQKRLRDEITAVESEINARKQQIEALTKRLEGLKRALELFDSEQPAITELLRTSIPDGIAPLHTREPAASPPAALKVSALKPKPRATPDKSKTAPERSSKPRRQLSARALKAAQAHLTEVREANASGKVKRPELIAAVLQANPRMTVQEIITALNKEFGWKSTASNLTGHLYTNPDRFAHTTADRLGKNPVRWSLK